MRRLHRAGGGVTHFDPSSCSETETGVPQTVTLLFADVEGSTRLLRALGDETYRGLQASLSDLMRGVFRDHAGEVIDTQGDSFFVGFARSPLDAVAAAVDCQRMLAARAWPGGSEVRVRIGVHTGLVRGAAAPPSRGYIGLDVHRAARLCEAGHGGQVLVSEATRRLLAEHLPAGLGLRALGGHQLRDMPEPEDLHQLLAPGLMTQFPPLRAFSLGHFNLPAQRTSLLGRERETIEILDLLSQQDTGLVTLCGPAGTGKTRLAITVAARARDMFKDGVCFVPLAPILDPGLVASSIVRRLGLQESGPTPVEEMLLGYLRNRDLLLVLDNVEHLLAAAPFIGELLAGCPSLRVLATSRAALRLHGEREYAVPPLGLPDLARLPPAEEFGRYHAIALFAERAAAVTARFEITPANFADVAALCARLDGLPLAIELAAARANLMTPRDMLDHLRHGSQHASLDLLSTGARDAPPRHRTLRAAIGWSLGLLDPTDQDLFRLLSVFVGGFTLSGAAALAAGAMAQDVAVLDRVGILAENSLLQRIERPGAPTRFAMLETIREYGLEQLEVSGGLAAAHKAHAACMLHLAETGATELGGPHQADWLARLDDEQANFRAALTWAFSPDCDDPDLGPRLVLSLWIFWFRRAYLREGRRWLQEAHAACAAPAPPLLRARLLTADGSFARMIGDFSGAETLLDDASALWRQIGDAEGLAWALSHLGLVKQWLGQLDAGVTVLEESLSLRRRQGEDRGIARSLFHLAIAEDFRGDHARAARLYEETLEVQRRIGDSWGSGRVLGYLAKAVLRANDPERAEGLCQRALELSGKVADLWGVGLAEAGLAGVAWARGSRDRAVELLKQSMLTFRDVGSRDRLAECIQELAFLARELGAPDQAVRLSAAAEAVQETGRLAFWPAVGARRAEEIEAARAFLGDAAFERAWARGHAMTAEEAVDDALTVRGDG